MQVFHLIDDRQAHFSDSVTPLEAVTHIYCEENNLMSAWFSNRQSNFYEFVKTLPVTYGKHSVSCGDWACFVETNDKL
jgi:hypothetical protein